MANDVCVKCGKPADAPMAYQCDVCGAESQTHDANHACGGDHCVVKCSGCKQPGTKCTC